MKIVYVGSLFFRRFQKDRARLVSITYFSLFVTSTRVSVCRGNFIQFFCSRRERKKVWFLLSGEVRKCSVILHGYHVKLYFHANTQCSSMYELILDFFDRSVRHEMKRFFFEIIEMEYFKRFCLQYIEFLCFKRSNFTIHVIIFRVFRAVTWVVFLMMIFPFIFLNSYGLSQPFFIVEYSIFESLYFLSLFIAVLP